MEPIAPYISPPSSYVDKRYFLEVDIKNQCVNVYEMYKDVVNPDGSFTHERYDKPMLIDRFICSTGLGDLTPVGTYYLPKGGEKGYPTPRFSWGYFNKFNCWARYLTRIDGGILFHSIIYSKQDVKTARTSTYYNLGSKASHGCIRLMVEDAKWIYDNCPAGTFVSITDKKPLNQQLKTALKNNQPPYGTTITKRPTVGPEGIITPSPTPTYTSTPKVTPSPTPKPTPRPTPSPTPYYEDTPGPDN